MEREFFSHYSQYLNRNMSILSYDNGTNTGVPVLAIPCQDGNCDNWEGFHMPEVLSEYIERGDIQLFCIDTVDKESWSDVNGNKEHRAWIQECYFQYVVNDAIGYIRARNASGKLPIITGCSLGATHAMICFLRRPDLFSGVLGLSGCYDTVSFWDGWCNNILYENAPLNFLENMPIDHRYIELYKQKKIIACVGQGAWEDMGISSTAMLRNVLEKKGVHMWADFWGFDVNHDWPWWYKQIVYFLPHLLEAAWNQ